MPADTPTQEAKPFAILADTPNLGEPEQEPELPKTAPKAQNRYEPEPHLSSRGSTPKPIV